MKVVLLLGASSTGKSTLCNELASKYHWKVADTDEFHYEAYPKATNAVKPVTDALSENCHECLVRYKLTDKIVDFAITRGLHFQDSGYELTPQSYYQEPTEEILKKAGVRDEDIPLLADFLREVVTNTEDLIEVMPFKGLKQFFNYYLDHTFAQELEPNDTIILDVNPHPEFDPAKISAALDEYVKDYSNDHQDQSIELFKVIAYCPPQILSERLQQREESGYEGNTGKGLFSFEQLSLLVTALPDEYEGSDIIDKLSPGDIGRIVEKHVERASVDVEIFTKARHYLAKEFGIHDDKPVKLVPNKKFSCDAIVDTSKHDAATLAKNLVKRINGCADPQLTTPRIK